MPDKKIERADDFISIVGIVIISLATSIVFSRVENFTCFSSFKLTYDDKLSNGLKSINSPFSIIK